MNKIVGEHKGNVFLLSTPGIASIVVFKSHASSILRRGRLRARMKFELIMLLAQLFLKF